MKKQDFLLKKDWVHYSCRNMMRKCLFLCLFAALWNLLDASENKIIFVICSPRSASTALECSFIERGDFDVLHEPFNRSWFCKEFHDEITERGDEFDRIHTDEEIKEKILKRAEQKPVFVKDMAHAVHEFLIKDKTFVSKSNVEFVFLIRDPLESIVSYCKKAVKSFPPLLNKMPTLVDYEKQYELFDHVWKVKKQMPAVFDAGDLISHPEAILRQLCNKTGIVCKNAVEWNKSTHQAWKSWEFLHSKAIRCEKFDRSAYNKSRGSLKYIPASFRDKFNEHYANQIPCYEKLFKRRLLNGFEHSYALNIRRCTSLIVPPGVYCDMWKAVRFIYFDNGLFAKYTRYSENERGAKKHVTKDFWGRVALYYDSECEYEYYRYISKWERLKGCIRKQKGSFVIEEGDGSEVAVELFIDYDTAFKHSLKLKGINEDREVVNTWICSEEEQYSCQFQLSSGQTWVKNGLSYSIADQWKLNSTVLLFGKKNPFLIHIDRVNKMKTKKIHPTEEYVLFHLHPSEEDLL